MLRGKGAIFRYPASRVKEYLTCAMSRVRQRVRVNKGVLLTNPWGNEAF